MLVGKRKRMSATPIKSVWIMVPLRYLKGSFLAMGGGNNCAGRRERGDIPVNRSGVRGRSPCIRVKITVRVEIIMFGPLFILFVAVPLVELWLLLQAGGIWGAWPTIAVVLLTGVVGASLARREGVRAITRMTEASARGELPTGAMFDGMAIFLGGALLLTPGFITDGIGFALLFPGSRNFLREEFLSWFGKRIQSGKFMMHTSGLDPTQGPKAPGSKGPGVGNGRVYDQTLDEED